MNLVTACDHPAKQRVAAGTQREDRLSAGAFLQHKPKIVATRCKGAESYL